MNPVIENYRDQVPNDPRTDDEIAQDYVQQYGWETMRKVPTFEPYYQEVLGRLYPPTVKEKAKQILGSTIGGFLGTLATVPEAVASLSAVAGQATVPGGMEQPAPRIEPGFTSDWGLRAAAEKLSPEPIQSLANSMPYTLIPQGIGSTGAFLAGGMAGAAAKVPAWAAAAGLGAVAGAQQGYQDAATKGATATQALQSMGLNAAVGTTEALPLAGMLQRINKGTGGTAGRIIANMLAESGEEAGQETLQAILGNLIASDVLRYDPQRGWSEGAGANATVGGVAGAFMSLLASGAGRMRGRAAQPAAEEPQRTEGTQETQAPPAPPTPGEVIAGITHPEDKAWTDQATEIAQRHIAGQLTPDDHQLLRGWRSMSSTSDTWSRYQAVYNGLKKTTEAANAIESRNIAANQGTELRGANAQLEAEEANRQLETAVIPEGAGQGVGNRPGQIAVQPTPAEGGAAPVVEPVAQAPVQPVPVAQQARGYTLEAINKMTPQQAWEILAPGSAPLSTAATAPTLEQQIRQELGITTPEFIPPIEGIPGNPIGQVTQVTPGQLFDMVDLKAAPVAGVMTGKGTKKAAFIEGKGDPAFDRDRGGRLYVDATAGVKKGDYGKSRKLGVFKTSDGLNVLVVTAYKDSNRNHYVAGEQAGVPYLDMVVAGYELIDTLKTKEPTKGFRATYSLAEYQPVAARLRALRQQKKATIATPPDVGTEINEGEEGGEPAAKLVLVTNETPADALMAQEAPTALPLTEMQAAQIIATIGDIDAGVLENETDARRTIIIQLGKNPALVTGIANNYELVEQLIGQIYDAYYETKGNAQDAGRSLAGLSPGTQIATGAEGAKGIPPGPTGVVAETRRHTYSGGAGIPADAAEITERFNQVLRFAPDQGLLVRVRDGVAQQEGVYDPQRRQVTLSLTDMANPGVEGLRITLHEIAHHVLAQESADVQAAVLAGIDTFTQEQLGIEQSLDPLIREQDLNLLAASLVQEGMTPEQAAAAAPSRMAEERLAESLAQQGLQQQQAQGIAANIMRVLKDLYYRLAMAIQAAWGREASPTLAKKYMENRFAAFLAGQKAMSVFQFMVPPMPVADVARTYTPTNPVGWLAERPGPDGTVIYGDVSDALIEWQLRHSRSRPEKPGAPSERSPVLVNSQIAEANNEQVLQDNLFQEVGKLEGVRRYVASTTSPGVPSWVRHKLGLPDPVKLKNAARNQVDAITKQPIPSNPDQTIADFLDAGNRAFTGNRVLANVNKEWTGIGHKTAKAATYVAENKEPTAQAVEDLKQSVNNFDNTDGLANEVANGIRRILRNPRLITDQLKALDVTVNGRVETEVQMVLNSKGFFENSFDMIDAMLVDNINFDMSIAGIRDGLLAANNRNYNPLTGDDLASQAKLAVLVTYAKLNPWLLVRSELRRTDLTDRQKIVLAIKESLTKASDIGAQINATGKAAKLAERALASFARERHKVQRLVQKLEENEAVAAAGTMALKFYEAEHERLEGLVGAWNSAAWGDGAPQHDPIKQTDGTWKVGVVKVALNSKQQMSNRADLERVFEHQAAYLAERAQGGELDGQYWQVMADHTEALARGVFSEGVVQTIYRSLGVKLTALTEQMVALGTSASRALAQMLNNYAGIKQIWRAKGEELGNACENAMMAAMKVLDIRGKNRDSYEVNFFEPVMRYMEHRRDLLESGLTSAQQWDSAFRDFGRWLESLPNSDPRKKLIAGKQVEFLKALRTHLKAQEAADLWFDTHVKEGVSDTKLGKDIIRKRMRIGLMTSPETQSKEFFAMMEAMQGTNPGEANWADLIGRDEIPGAWANMGKIRDGEIKINDANGNELDGAAAASASLAPYFKNERVQRWFLQEIATMEPETMLPGMLQADGTTRLPLNPYVAEQAYSASGGDVVKMADIICRMEGGTSESAGEYLQQVLDVLAGYYRENRTQYDNHSPDVAGLPPSMEHLIPGLMVNARSVMHQPAAWRKHLMFDRHTMRRAMDMKAAQEAFGVNHESLISLYKTVAAEVTADTQKLAAADSYVKRNAGGGSLPKAEFEKRMIAQPEIGSAKELERLYKVKSMADLPRNFQLELAEYFQGQHGKPEEFRFGRNLISFFTNRLLQTPGSALTIFADPFNYMREYGVSRDTIRDLAGVPFKLARELIGSLTQAASASLTLPINSQAERALFRIAGNLDPLVSQDLMTQLREPGQQGEAWTAKGSRFLRKAEALASFGVVDIAGKAKGLNRATAATSTVLRPTALFTQISLTVNHTLAVTSIQRMERYLRQGMAYLRNNPGAAQDVTFGLKEGEWAKALQLARDNRNTFEKFTGTMRDGYGLDFSRLVREALAREAAGEYVMSDDTVMRTAFSSLNEVSMEKNIATMSSAAFNNSVFQAQIPLLGWMIMQSGKIAHLGMDSKGTGTRWFQIPRNMSDVSTLTSMLLTLAIMSAGGMAIGMLIDWYNEELLGKRRNLRQLSAKASPHENFFAILEQTARIGTFGLMGDVANAALNIGTGEGANRGISLDQRIVAASSFLNLQRAISNFVNQDWKADYVGVIRPMMQTFGANGMLQYLQLISNNANLDNPERRAVARTNASNWLRAVGRTIGIEVKSSRGGFNTPTPITPYITYMQLAAYANDPADFRQAWRDAVRVAREEEKDDPEGSIRRAFEARHPLLSIYRVRPSTAEYQRILRALPDTGRQDVSEAVNLFNRYAQSIGLKGFIGSVERAPRVESFTMRPSAFSGMGQPRFGWGQPSAFLR